MTMLSATHPSLAHEVATDVAQSAKWYAAAAVAGAIGGAVFGYFDYTPPAPVIHPIVAPQPASEATPVMNVPAQKPSGSNEEGDGAALVAQNGQVHRISMKNEPTYCVDQMNAAGTVLGRLCVPEAEKAKIAPTTVVGR